MGQGRSQHLAEAATCRCHLAACKCSSLFAGAGASWPHLQTRLNEWAGAPNAAACGSGGCWSAHSPCCCCCHRCCCCCRGSWGAHQLAEAWRWQKGERPLRRSLVGGLPAPPCHNQTHRRQMGGGQLPPGRQRPPHQQPQLLLPQLLLPPLLLPLLLALPPGPMSLWLRRCCRLRRCGCALRNGGGRVPAACSARHPPWAWPALRAACLPEAEQAELSAAGRRL